MASALSVVVPVDSAEPVLSLSFSLLLLLFLFLLLLFSRGGGGVGEEQAARVVSYVHNEKRQTPL